MAHYKKTPGAATLFGQQYEYKMASLLYLRGFRHTAGFGLGTNVAGAGAFDDVVYKYKLQGETEFRTCFVQLKHNKKGNSIISLGQLLMSSGDYSVYKYYKSWCEVAMNVGAESCMTPGLFDVDFNKCDFLIYTNGRIDKSLTTENEMTDSEKALFVTSKDSRHSKLSVFNESCIGKIKEECDKHKTNDIFLKETLKEVMEKRPVEDFLRSLRWFTGQSSEAKLTSLIEEEINTILESNVEDTKIIAKIFVEKVKHWWEETGTSVIITETAPLWKETIIWRLNLMNDLKRKEVEALKISFSDHEIDSFNQSLCGSHAINVTSAHTNLTSLKISQILAKHYSERFLFIDQMSLWSWKTEVLRAWQSVWCDVLVINCSTGAKALANELKVPTGKKLILLSQSALPGYQQLNDIFNLKQLEATSQNLLMEKVVDFQGDDVSLGSVLGEHYTHALNGVVATQLLTSDFKLKVIRKLEGKIPLEKSETKEDFMIISVQEDYFLESNQSKLLDVETGEELSVNCKLGCTALHVSASKGHVDVVKCLIDSGADLTVVDDRGRTALQVAAYKGHIDVVKCLVQVGADLNAKDDRGLTALHKSASKGHIVVVKCLIQAGADLNVKNDRGLTALHMSASKGYIDVVKCLMQAGADLNVKDDRGLTALHMSAAKGNAKVVKCLSKSGADLNVRVEKSASKGNVGVGRCQSKAAEDLSVKVKKSASKGNVGVGRCQSKAAVDLSVKVKKSASKGNVGVGRCQSKAAEDLNVKVKKSASKVNVNVVIIKVVAYGAGRIAHSIEIVVETAEDINVKAEKSASKGNVDVDLKAVAQGAVTVAYGAGRIAHGMKSLMHGASIGAVTVAHGAVAVAHGAGRIAHGIESVAHGSSIGAGSVVYW